MPKNGAIGYKMVEQLLIFPDREYPLRKPGRPGIIFPIGNNRPETRQKRPALPIGIIMEENKNQPTAKDPADIGRIVRAARKKAGLRQAQAAALCGVGTRFLSDLENGKPTLHLGKVLQVMKGFGLLVVIKRKGFADGRSA